MDGQTRRTWADATSGSCSTRSRTASASRRASGRPSSGATSASTSSCVTRTPPTSWTSRAPSNGENHTTQPARTSSASAAAATAAGRQVSQRRRRARSANRRTEPVDTRARYMACSAGGRFAIAVPGRTPGTTGISWRRHRSRPERALTVRWRAPRVAPAGRRGALPRPAACAAEGAVFGAAFGAAFGVAVGAVGAVLAVDGATGVAVGAAFVAGSARGRRTGWVGRGVTASPPRGGGRGSPGGAG